MPSSISPRNPVFAGYLPAQGFYDELFEADGGVRHHAGPFVDTLNKLGRIELSHRWQQAQRLVHEKGFGHHGYANRAHRRPWDLDPLPLLIPEEQWAYVTRGLKQRATLLDMILRDVYGEQDCVKSGVLPAEVLYSHPGFHPAFCGQSPPENRYLHFYAADVARSPDGQWWVLGDRTEAPSGVGYALENRVVIARVWSDVFRRSQVKRLSSFFVEAKKTLQRIAPRHEENPRVVMLCDGPDQQNYFEAAYLARYLGYTLAEAGDLTVRDNRVMLKTLGGLKPVEVILRRRSSPELDPLELSNDVAGIAGLMQAARDGHVAIANAMGSGLVESPIMMAFLPQLCQHFLGRELKMPGVATWWCGNPEHKDYVLSRLDELNVYPAFRERGRVIPPLAEMPAEQLRQLIQTSPEKYVAQERVERSCAPIWRPLEPAHLALRTYAVAAEDHYEVMQGALTRVSASLDPLDISLRNGEESKDTWILSDEPVDSTVTLLGVLDRKLDLRRGGVEIPSRMADNLFWLGRQLERTESIARLLRSTVSRMTGETLGSEFTELPALLRCLAVHGQIEPGYALDGIRESLPPIEDALPAAVFDTGQQTCLRAIVDEFFRLASILRDRLSRDTWQIARRIDEGFRPRNHGETRLSDLLEMTDDLISDTCAWSGMVMESTTRTHAFRFLELGRRIERSMQILTLLRHFLFPLPEMPAPLLETVLEIADSSMTYRSRYLANLELAAVLDLLLTDESNPRSLAFQFSDIDRHVDRLPQMSIDRRLTTEQRLAKSLLHDVQMAEIESLSVPNQRGELKTLDALATRWQRQLPQLADAISHRFFMHTVPLQQL